MDQSNSYIIHVKSSKTFILIRLFHENQIEYRMCIIFGEANIWRFDEKFNLAML